MIERETKVRPLLCILTVAGVFGLTGCSRLTVSRVVPQDAPKPAKGFLYALPRTVLQIDVPIERTDQRAGVFARYAPVFFPSEKSVVVASTSFDLGVGKIVTRSEADPAQIFQVDVRSHWLEKKAISLELTPEGVLKGTTASSEDQTLEFALQVVNTAVGVAEKTFKAAEAQKPAPLPATVQVACSEPPESAFCQTLAPYALKCFKVLEAYQRDFYRLRLEPSQRLRDYLCSLDPTSRGEFMGLPEAEWPERQRMSNTEWTYYKQLLSPAEQGVFLKLTAAERAVFRTLPPSQRDFYRQVPDTESEAAFQASLPPPLRLLYTDLNLSQRAVFRRLGPRGMADAAAAGDAYKAIRTVVDNRRALLRTPTAGGDRPKSLETLLKEFDQETVDLKQQWFLGSKNSSTWTFSVSLTPQSDHAVKSFQLFTFSSSAGVCKVLAEDPLPVEDGFQQASEGGCVEGKPGRVFLQLSEPDTVSTRVRSAIKDGDKGRSFYYRIPSLTTAALFAGDEEKGRATLPVAQFGALVSLPESSLGRKTAYGLELDPVSGAPLKASMNSVQTLQPSAVKDLGDSATALYSAAAAAKEARKKANAPQSELDKLKEENAILEQKVKKKEYEEKLSPPVPPEP